MLKKLTATTGIAALATAISTTIPMFAAAGLCPQNVLGTSGNFNALCSLSFTDNTFGNIVTIIFIVAILLALAYLIWGGIKWVLSGGDKGKVDAARQAIVAAIVGLVIVFLSYFIINIVVPIFVPGFSLNNVTLPKISQ